MNETPKFSLAEVVQATSQPESRRDFASLVRMLPEVFDVNAAIPS